MKRSPKSNSFSPSAFSAYSLSVLGSGCGFLIQTLVLGFWTTAYSQDVTFFSVGLACYFLAMGLGALWGGKRKEPTLGLVTVLTLGIASWTGLCIPFLRTSITLMGQVWVVPILAVMVGGFLAGSLIPLLLRIPKLKVELPLLFLLDYFGAIVFTLAFTMVCLIPLGYQRTGALLALGVGAMLLLLGTGQKGGRIMALIPVLVGGFFFWMAPRKTVAPKMGDGANASIILHQEQSHYQKIVLTEEKRAGFFTSGGPTHVLYLDGFVQFSTLDEQIYHACLVNIPMAAAQENSSSVKSALVLGGGDGLVVRNILQSKAVKKVELVELDPAMIRLAKTNPVMNRYNLKSLDDPRVEVRVQDAFQYMFHSDTMYDLIVIDFPAPKNLSLARLFTVEFYQAVLKHLNPGGVISIQAGPSYAHSDPNFMTISEVTASIAKSMQSAGAQTQVYATYPDNEAFVLATKEAFPMESFARKMGIYSKNQTPYLCSYNPDWIFPAVEINTLNRLPVAKYMIDWFHKAGGMFFNYQGNYSVFLPS